jgi:hypothetical protein
MPDSAEARKQIPDTSCDFLGLQDGAERLAGLGFL